MSVILTTTRMSEEALNIMRDVGHELVFCDAAEWEEKCRMAKECGAAAVACRGGAFPKEFFDELPDLKILALPSAGFDNVDLETAAAHGTWVTNAAGGNARSVAELAFLLILGVAKRLDYNMNVAREVRPWRGRKMQTFTEITGKTVALLGFGNIARELASMCHGFGMNVIAYHPRIEEKDVPDYCTPCNDLYEAIKNADIVSSHIPAREANYHLINADVFNAMKDSAIFVNTGRGSVVDEAALIAALESGKLMGAGLDVFEEEPTALDNPLLFMDNCVCTPHIGGETHEAKAKVYRLSAQNVVRVLAGEEPLTPVNQVK